MLKLAVRKEHQMTNNPIDRLIKHLVVEVLSHTDAEKMQMHELSEALRKKAKDFNIEMSITSAAHHILDFIHQ